MLVEGVACHDTKGWSVRPHKAIPIIFAAEEGSLSLTFFALNWSRLSGIKAQINIQGR